MNECLEGPGRTPEEMAADRRELNRVAPTPADKFQLMFNPKINEPLRHRVLHASPSGPLGQDDQLLLHEEELRGRSLGDADSPLQPTDLPPATEGR